MLCVTLLVVQREQLLSFLVYVYVSLCLSNCVSSGLAHL